MYVMGENDLSIEAGKSGQYVGYAAVKQSRKLWRIDEQNAET
jgi:hypothetical protein